MMAHKSACVKVVVVLLGLITVCVPAGAQMWTQTDWSGGPGQLTWGDSAMYYTGVHEDGWRLVGDLKLDTPDDSNWSNTGDLAGASYVWSLIEASDGALYAGTGFTDGDVFKSVNAGTTWVNTGDLAGATRVWSLIETSQGMLYAGTGLNGDAFKSIDAGTTWGNTGDITGASHVFSLMETSDGALYVGTDAGGDVFKSVNAGTTWVNTGDIPGALLVRSLVEASDGALYAGTAPFLGDVFMSINAGTTWVNTGELVGVTHAYFLAAASDGALYSGTAPNGDVFRSTDAGTTWVNTGELAGATEVWQLIESPSGALYAGTLPNGDVFKSIDGGTTWGNTGDLAGATEVHSLTEDSDGALYAGTYPGGNVFKAGYFLAGDIVSSVYDIGSTNVTYGTMTWNETPNGQTISMLVRTDTLPDMYTAMDWDTCPPVVNGQDISDLASVDDFERYVQYRVQLLTSRSDVTPILHDVSVEYALVGVDEGLGGAPLASSHQLLQSRPNPFSGRTVISYSIPAATHVTLDVYDLSGRLVETLVDGTREPGIHRVSWNATERSAGLYFYRLRTGDFESTRKMVVID